MPQRRRREPGAEAARPPGRVLVVIPARYDSTSFPGKALADLAGAPLVVRVAEQAARMKTADRVVVATDDERIARAVADAGFEVEVTGPCRSGSDRVAYVAEGEVMDGVADPADLIVVNYQGDEPLLDPADADGLVKALRQDREALIATLAHPFFEPADWPDPNVVKVLVDLRRRALYFSRAIVPGRMPGRPPLDIRQGHPLRHIGIYAYRWPALEELMLMGPTPLEQIEGLEQLRALEHGMGIAVVVTLRPCVGVDTPADLERVRELWAERVARALRPPRRRAPRRPGPPATPAKPPKSPRRKKPAPAKEP